MQLLRKNIHQNTQQTKILQPKMRRKRPPRTQKKLGLQTLPQKQKQNQQHKTRHPNNRTTQTPKQQQGTTNNTQRKTKTNL